MGVSLLKPAVRGALAFVNEERLLDGLLKADPRDRSATARYLDTVTGLLQELGLEGTLFYALWLSLARSAREDERFYEKVHEALVQGAREWRATRADRPKNR